MKFSVLVCTYNYSHLLKDALRTLAAQTVPDFELLIVDDGSTDSTREVVQEFAPQFCQCRYLQKPHTGLADSRNFGIQAATGTHIAFLDADDFWSPEYLATVCGLFENQPEAELTCSDGWRVDEAGQVLGSLYPAGLPPVCGRLSTPRDLFSFFRYSLPSTTCVARSLYDRIGFYDSRFPVGHDHHWIIRAVSQGAFCVRLDHKLALYRKHRENLTVATPPEVLLDDWLAMYADVLRNHKMGPEVECLAFELTRRGFPSLLARYSSDMNRKLLSRVMQEFGCDWSMRLAYFLTYFGLCGLAQCARRAKHAFRKARPGALRMDLHAPPETLFAAVLRNS